MKNCIKLGIGGIVLMVVTLMFGWLLFPMMVKMQMHSQIALKNGTPTRGLWSKFPFALEFRVYLFNVSNPDEIKNGAKPIVSEVGPYFFEEWQEKTHLLDREEDDTVEFKIKNKWIFKPEMSQGLTGNEQLTLPHVFIMAMVLSAHREKPAMVSIVNKAVNSIFKNPSNVFMQMRAMDLMFDGLPIDCTVKDFAGSAVCSMLKDSDDVAKDGENTYKFSIFGSKNDTSSKARMRVLRGIKNLIDVGTVVEYDGKKNISKWGDDYCDTFNGTDGTIFHPFLYAKEDVVSFSPDLCRSLSATFSEKTEVAGLSTNRYTAFLGDPENIPSQKCYCEAPDKCLKKGVMDVFKCSGAPFIASHPHFYLAHEDYLDGVVGLNPSKEKHAIFLDFEPMTGTPLSARKRLQFNVMLQKVERFKVMKNFPEALLPLFWIEEGVVLPDDLLNEIKSGHKLMHIVKCIKWILLVASVLMIAFAGFWFKKSYKNVDITVFKNSPKSVKSNSPIKDLSPVRGPPTVE